MQYGRLKPTLDRLYQEVNVREYLQHSPMQMIHNVSTQTGCTYKDIEAMALILAPVAFGDAISQVNISKVMYDLTEKEPYNWLKLGGFIGLYLEKSVYRRVTGKDIVAAFQNIRQFYVKHGSVADYIRDHTSSTNELLMLLGTLLKPVGCGLPIGTMPPACLRLCQLMRWMCRGKDMDFDIWGAERAPDLYAIMSANIYSFAKKHAMVSYPQYKWQAVLELTDCYCGMDRQDPLKYDIAIAQYVQRTDPKANKELNLKVRKITLK